MLVMTHKTYGFRRWLPFAIVSAVFFHITGSTFTSLGVVLPFMIEDMSWNWSRAGAGFSLLALMVGLASTVPTWTLRKFGIRATFAAGGLLMASGFALLALTQGLNQYFLAMGLLGVGYTLCCMVPAIHMINNWLPDRRSFAIGLYMTIGGLGGVAGPIIVTSIIGATDSWRVHWWAMAASILLLVLIATIFVRSQPPEMRAGSENFTPPREEKRSHRVFKAESDWRFRELVRTPQFHVIVASLTITLLCGLTANSWAVTHMVSLGIPLTMAAGALSAHAAINSLSRALGGVLGTHIDPKWLLVSGLAAEIVGMLALSVADDPATMLLFALFEGYGFGMCLFATTVLLVNYFGASDTPESLGTMNLITTLAMVGPVLAGFVSDTFGSFAGAFQGYSVILFAILVAAVMMKPPRKTPAVSDPH